MSLGGEIYHPDYDFRSMPTSQLQEELFEARTIVQHKAAYSDHFRGLAKRTRDAIKAVLIERGIKVD